MFKQLVTNKIALATITTTGSMCFVRNASQASTVNIAMMQAAINNGSNKLNKFFFMVAG
jgi:signal recognition particle receptor subunit beta